MAFTDAQIAEAKRMLRDGMKQKDVAAQFGCNITTLKCAINTEYRAKRLAHDREKKARARAAFKADFPHGLPHIDEGPSRLTSDEIASRLALIPEDTRSLTGRICGDPLPPRSALGRRA